MSGGGGSRCLRLLIWLAQDMAVLRERLSEVTGDHHIPGMSHSSPSSEEHWWHVPAGRVSQCGWSHAGVTAVCVGAGRSCSQWGLMGSSTPAPAMSVPPMVLHGFVLDEPSCRSLSRQLGPCLSLGCGADPSMLTCPPLPFSPGAESFGLFSCMINGEEQEQTHRAVFR